MSTSSSDSKVTAADTAKSWGGNRPTNVLAAILGLFLLVSSFAAISYPTLNFDRSFVMMTACLGLGLLLYAVGDEARIFHPGVNFVGASAIGITLYFIWQQSDRDASRYNAEALVLWKDPKAAAKILDGPNDDKPRSITVALKSRLIKGSAQEIFDGTGYKFDLHLNDKDVTDFLDTPCPIMKVVFQNRKSKQIQFSKNARKLHPNDYNTLFVLKYYIDDDRVSAIRDKEFYLPACDSEEAAEAKDARQVEGSELLDKKANEQPTTPTTPPSTAKQVLVGEADSGHTNSRDSIGPPPESTSNGSAQQARQPSIIGYVLFSRFNGDRPKRNRSWFEIEKKPDAKFPAPGDTLRVTEDEVALRGIPYHWNDAARKHIVPSSPPLAKLRRDQKIIVAGDAIVSSDETNGDQYAIVPISSIGGATALSGDVMPLNPESQNLKGYVYIGYIDQLSGEFANKIFTNTTKPDSVYPSPDDILVATSGVWLRSSPRRWDPERKEYFNGKTISAIRQGQFVRVGGDVLLAKGGTSIWVPIAEIYENGIKDVAKQARN